MYVRSKDIQASSSCYFLTLIDGWFIGFPEDDRLENEFYAAQRRCNKIRAVLDSESRAAEILAKAVRYMDACQSSMQEAVGYSRYGPLHVPFLYFIITDLRRTDHQICGEVEGVQLSQFILKGLS